MAYNKDKFQLTHLLQRAWYRMGQLRSWTATGGSTSTLINTDWAGVEEPQFEDNDPALIYGTVVVVEDSAGLGAAPEGEMGMITAYDSSSSTVTFDAITSAISANDRVGIASPLLPLQDMIELANIALQKLGEIDLVDTSLVVNANQTEYSLPATIQKKPIRVRQQVLKASNNNQWKPVPNWGVIPATSGSNWTLTLPQLTNGYSLEVLYRDRHPKVKSFSDFILPAIHPELAVNALVAEAYQWYNNTVGGSNTYFLQRENKAIQDLEASIIKFPIHHEVEQVQGMVHWGISGDYIPGTSDLRA